MLQALRAIGVRLVVTRDVIVDQLGDRRVLADDDEARRHADLALLPELEGLFVVPVERLHRRLEHGRQLQRIDAAGVGPVLLRHVVADVDPKIAILRHFVVSDILGDRHAR